MTMQGDLLLIVFKYSTPVRLSTTKSSIPYRSLSKSMDEHFSQKCCQLIESRSDWNLLELAANEAINGEGTVQDSVCIRTLLWLKCLEAFWFTNENFYAAVLLMTFSV